jgi:hypothetical protein
MKIKTALVAGVALGALVACGASAQAAPAPHKKHAASAAGETQALKDEVQALRAEVQALESRLDAQAQAQQQTAAQAQAAQAQAQTAQSTAQAAQAQVQADASKVETIPAQVDTATKKVAPKPGWWNDTKVGATMFADASYIDNRNANGKTAQSGTNFDIKRMYLSVDHKFNDIYSFNVTTDFTFDNNSNSPSGAASPTNNEAGGANTAAGIKSTQLYLKKAYLQAHYADAFNVRLGAADMPWIPFVEGIYGYRYVEQTLIDRTKFGTSSDWGVHVFGNLFANIVGYQVSVIDGEGYKQPSLGTVNRTRSIDVEGRINATYKHFTVAVGGYDGKLGANVEGVNTYNDAQRIDVLAAYTDKKVRLGFEYLWARYWKDVTQSNPAKTNDSEGYSVFASYNFTPKVSIFGKYEYVKPKTNTAPTENENYFNVGLSYKPIAPLDFALVYKRDDLVNGSFSTGNGIIGIPTGASTGKGTYDEIGLFTQVKF